MNKTTQIKHMESRVFSSYFGVDETERGINGLAELTPWFVFVC